MIKSEGNRPRQQQQQQQHVVSRARIIGRSRKVMGVHHVYSLSKPTHGNIIILSHGGLKFSQYLLLALAALARRGSMLYMGRVFSHPAPNVNKKYLLLDLYTFFSVNYKVNLKRVRRNLFLTEHHIYVQVPPHCLPLLIDK